jgi:hypothetical protein
MNGKSRFLDTSSPLRGCRRLGMTNLEAIVAELAGEGGGCYMAGYSYRSASIGSRFAARMAGIMPLITPTTARITIATIRTMGETTSRISPASACEASALYRVKRPTDNDTA